MNDLDTLRPEVRSALGAMVRADVCRDSVPTDAFDIIRAELLRLAGEVTELRTVCAATYQAAGCYGLPERFKDALSNAATGERTHDVDVDNLCPVDPVEWVERAEEAEAELAEMKQTFDLRWKADMRAIEQWRVAHPGNELVMPDHADMCVWLMSELAAVKARIAEGWLCGVSNDACPGNFDAAIYCLPSRFRGKRVRLVVEE